MMTTPAERLTSRLKVVDRLRINIPWLSSPTRSPGIQAFTKSTTGEIPANTPGSDPLPADETPAGYPSLQDLLAESGASSPLTLVLGMCEDHLPLMLYLTNPAPGALLAVGDTGAGKTRLVRSALFSAALMNTPEQLTYTLIAADLAEYTDLAEFAHCRKLAPLSDAPSIIDELFLETEKRRLKPSEPMILVAIEDIAEVANNLNLTMLTRLHHLIKHGPRLGIWVIATLSCEDLEYADPALLDAFRTHLLGSIADPLAANYLGRDDHCPAPQIEKGRQFCASVEGGWLYFWICDPTGGAA